MTPEQAEDAAKAIDSARAAARVALTEIAAVKASSRDRVRVAYRLGVNKREIHELSGIARTTIDRWLGHQR